MEPKELMDRIQKLEIYVKKTNELLDLMPFLLQTRRIHKLENNFKKMKESVELLLLLLQARRMLENCKEPEQAEEVLKELFRKHRHEAHRTEDLKKSFDCALCETIMTIQ
ncbi:MAG: hypothetical protein ACREQA_10115 [Candidatus Binatia bacterium]